MFPRFLATAIPLLLFLSLAVARPSNGATQTDAAKRKAFLESQKSGSKSATKAAPAKKPPIPTSRKTVPPPKRPLPPSSKRNTQKITSKSPPPPTPKNPSKPVPKPTPKPSPVSKPLPPPPSEKSTTTEKSSSPPPINPDSTTTAPVVIEKSNELAQPLESEKRGFFSLFGSKPKGKYITAALRDQINRPPVTKGRWKYIVVHNSGTRQGNAKAFHDYHSRVRKMQNGLAYHFVIGNGTSTGDGQIEIGNRWKIQLAGGHVHSDYLNNVGIGICLVGDFNHHKPTPKQLESLEELIRFLRNRVGKSEGSEAIVKPHREINPPRWPTDCPGDQFPYSWLKSRF